MRSTAGLRERACDGGVVSGHGLANGPELSQFKFPGRNLPSGIISHATPPGGKLAIEETRRAVLDQADAKAASSKGAARGPPTPARRARVQQHMRPKMLTPDMKRIVEEQRLGFVATSALDGTPNVSPKGTFVVLDDATIAFGEIRSPGTIRNLRDNPRIEVNFVDPFVRRGYRFAGTAHVVEQGTDGFDNLLAHFRGALAGRIRAIVAISVTKALPLTSPAYDDGKTELELRRLWTSRFRKLQPNGSFEG